MTNDQTHKKSKREDIYLASCKTKFETSLWKNFPEFLDPPIRDFVEQECSPEFALPLPEDGTDGVNFTKLFIQ